MKHPNLTRNDLRLISYLKINLTSKEIARISSLTVQSVGISRNRLRKKLNLPSGTNLFEYLNSI